jgi:hypothetical protein
MADYLEMLRGLLGAFSPREAEAKMFPMDDRASAMVKAQREAQAPAPGTPEAEDPLTGRWFSPERRALYQDIGRATEAHPRTVEVAAPTLWPDEYMGSGGLYYPESDKIAIAPRGNIAVAGNRGPEMIMNLDPENRPHLTPTPAGALPTQDVLAHEQLHFLMSKLVEAEKAEVVNRMNGMSDRGKARFMDRSGTLLPGAKRAYGDDDRQHAVINYLLGGYTAPAMIKQTTYKEPMTGAHPPAASPEIADAYRRLIHQIFPDEARRARALAGLGAARGGTLLEELR